MCISEMFLGYWEECYLSKFQLPSNSQQALPSSTLSHMSLWHIVVMRNALFSAAVGYWVLIQDSISCSRFVYSNVTVVKKLNALQLKVWVDYKLRRYRDVPVSVLSAPIRQISHILLCCESFIDHSDLSLFL